jgi:predicted heme/steroid binding protein/CheY-like chemotaxis protein
MESIRVLLIEDNPGDARQVKDYLADYQNPASTVDSKGTLADGIRRLPENKFDVILLDLGLPDSPQRSVTFTRTQSAAPAIPIVVLSGLDDEIFAVTTVRRGAQDYMIKGKFDTDTLVRTIHYAIARKLGGTRRFTIDELKQFDGQEGRPAYMAFKGKVYDVTNSKLWKGGKHAAVHLAGTDLTESIARAPHGEDSLSKVSVVGELVKKEALQKQLALRIESLHLHPTAIHFSVSYAPLALILFIGYP